MSNALGILRYMKFCEDFLTLMKCRILMASSLSDEETHEETRVYWGGKLLIPTMNNFFSRHHNFNIEALTADPGFDTPINYEYFFIKHNILSIIDFNPRAVKDGFEIPGINEDNILTYPKNTILPMKYDSPCKGKIRPFRNKFICPNAKKLFGGKYFCFCEDSCTTLSCRRMIYTYFKDKYRAHILTPRGTDEWEKYSCFRYIIEQVILRLKFPLQLGSSFQIDSKTIKADFFLAGAACLVTVLLVYRKSNIDKI